MSQNYNDIAGSEAISDSWGKLKDRDDAVLSSNSGATAPSYVVEGMLWKDTTTGKLKEYHQGSWRILNILSASDVPYSNTSSLLTASNTQAAIDEVESRVDGVETALGGHTVGVNVPATAVFTDTQYTHPDNHPASMITEDATHNFVTEDQIASWDSKSSGLHHHDTRYEPLISDKKTGFNLPLGFSEGTVAEGNHGHSKAQVGLSNVDNTSDMAKPVSNDQATAIGLKADKTYVDNKVKVEEVPADAVFTDTTYTHPDNHPASMILEDADHRFVSDTEKNTWNGKAAGDHNHNTIYLGISDKAADSDKLDSLNSTQFLRSDADDTMTAQLKIQHNLANPTYSTGQLELRSTDASDASLGFHRSGHTACQLRHSSNGLILSGTSRTNAADFYCYGNVTAYSDINLKQDIEIISGALEKVSQIRGVTYTRTNDNSNECGRQTGVIAQEVLEVLPEAVSGGPTEENPDGYYSVAYGNMVGLLVEAIKELKAEVEELKNGITK